MPKRDMDLVRSILLRVEELEPGHYFHDGVVESIAEGGVAADVVNYHVGLLFDAGYLDMSRNHTIAGLTWVGHDFIDSVRDADVWSNTKKRAHSVGGWTFDILKDVARSILKDKLRELGLPL